MNKYEKNHSLHSCAGFTLIEVLLVVAILGILAGVVVVNFGGRQQGAMIRATRASISNVATAINLYEMDTGRFPPSLQSLIQNDGAPNWNGPYIQGDLPRDAWGTPFEYRNAGDGTFKIISAGPDMQMGTSDDITSF